MILGRSYHFNIAIIGPIGLKYRQISFWRRIVANPDVPQKSPYGVEVVAGKNYFWCACGKSAKQPFCDGSHNGTEFEPTKFEATESKTVYFCSCKQTANKPLCDGSHNKL
jgi:CDGSH-type Zn-finger protein